MYLFVCVFVMFVASCLLTPWQDCFNLVYDCFKFETVLSVGLKLGYTLNPRVCHIGHFFFNQMAILGVYCIPHFQTRSHISYIVGCVSDIISQVSFDFI